MNQTRAEWDLVLEGVEIKIDYAVRSVSVVVHVVYFLMIILTRALRRCSLLYLHQLNFVGFLLSLHAAAYIGSLRPAFASEWLNEKLCFASEILWTTLGSMRSWSLLLLAALRHTAVFRVNLHKKWNARLSRLLLPCLALWLAAFAAAVGLKLSLDLHPSQFMCSSGRAKSTTTSVIYLTLASGLFQSAPCALMLLIYVHIIRRLQSNRRKVFKTQSCRRIELGQCMRPTVKTAFRSKAKQEIQLFILSVLVALTSLVYVADGVINFLESNFTLMTVSPSLIVKVTIMYHSLESFVPLLTIYSVFWSKIRQIVN
nr:G protein-coupled receptor [Proales similis]